MKTTKWWRATSGGFSGLVGEVDLFGVFSQWIFWKKKREPKEAPGVREIKYVVTVRRKTDQFNGDISPFV